MALLVLLVVVYWLWDFAAGDLAKKRRRKKWRRRGGWRHG